MAERNEAALIARARGGESSAFEELIRPYEGRVYQVVLRITRNPADAADVYQCFLDEVVGVGRVARETSRVGGHLTEVIDR